MSFAQIPFFANDKLDVLGDEIDTVSQLNKSRIPACKSRIDFNDDWATFRPPEFNVRWPPAKVESSQAAQRNIGDTFILVISQLGRKGVFTKDKMRWRPKLSGGNRNDFISPERCIHERQNAVAAQTQRRQSQ
ncbi:hypothetical protein X733_33525 [Mesorhizobium sp. L2C067A000]|nr:hypothetical protein X733_33525 [Mesorhizobium sp. L2C067A000]